MRITTADYRHIAVALDREHVRGLTDGLNPEEEDAHDLQASHSTTTADAVYGVRGDILRSLTSRSITIFKSVTDRWHIFLGLKSAKVRENGSRLSKLSTHGVKLGAAPSVAPSAKRRRIGIEDVEEKVMKVLVKFGGERSSFKSEEQRQAVMAVVKGKSPLVVVLPTGGGKSLMFMVPALMEGAKTTIVILPFVALAENMNKRC